MSARPSGARRATISVCLPARNEAATIARALTPLLGLLGDGAIGQLVVVDESDDGTGIIAAALGAEVHRQSALMPEFGPVRGKGDAMWRSLTVLDGDIIIWLDADCRSVSPDYVSRLAAPIRAGTAELSKAFYRRPLGADPNGGGRVNHLVARPLLRRFYPELAALTQPLSGETAMLRSLALRLPFACGFGVELAHLIDAAELGARLTQVDLGVHQHRHKPTEALGAMADELLDVVMHRQLGGPAPLYRPAMQTVMAPDDRSLLAA